MLRTQPQSHTQAARASLFELDITDKVILSCHLLGKPTTAQLRRLHSDTVSSDRSMRRILDSLTRSPQAMLDMIAPIEIDRPSQNMPRIYLDTVRSRRHLERTKAIPYRRPPELPSRDWRFLRHDVTLVDELISHELTARRYRMRFGYESHYDMDGNRVYPKVTITDGDHTHTLKPQPDKTVLIGDYHNIIEHDCGEETIELGHIIRDATLSRKHLVYDQLERSGHLDRLGWGERIYTYVVDGKKQTQTSSRKRIRSCLEKFPELQIDAKTYFIDRQSYMEAGNDVSQLEWQRRDGKVMKLPCYR